MKPTASLIRFAPILATLALATSLHAADGTWTSTATSGNWINTDTSPWQSGIVADGNTSTANFTSNITALTTVTLTAPRTIGNITFSDNGAAGSAWTIAGSGANILTLGDTGAGTTSPIINALTDATLSSNLAGNDGFTKTGAGTLTINTATANSIAGTLNVNQGKLALNYGSSASNTAKVATTSILALGGGTFEMIGVGSGFTSVQNFAGLTINSGASTSTSTQPGSATTGVNYGSISRTGIGGTVNFTGNALHQTNGQANTNGIIGGYATYNGTSWVVGTAAFGNLTSLATYTATASSTATTNVDVTASATLSSTAIPAGPSAANSLRFNTAAASTLTLNGATNITTGGILVTSTVGNNASTISGGTSLAGAAGKDLIVHQNNTANTLTIASRIVDNTSATGLTKSGAGELILSGTNNSYTGITTVNTGTLSLSGGSAIANTGAVSLANVSGAALKLNTSEAIGSLAGGGANGGNVNLQANTLTAGDATSTAYAGVISGTGGFTKTGSGTQTFSNTNLYSGTTTINGGVLALASTGTLGTASEVALGGGSLDVSAKVGGYSVAKVTGSGNVTGSLTVTSQLAIGNSAGTVGFQNLTLGGGSTSVFEVGGGSGDLANVTGTLNLGSSTLDLNSLAAYVPNEVYTLFGYTAGNLTGTFAGLADGGVFSDAGGEWKIDYDASAPGINGGTGDRFVTLTAVPEPAAALLGGLGLLALLRRRRN